MVAEVRLTILALNPWSAFLVLMTIQGRIFQEAQEGLLARTFMDDEVETEDGNDEQASNGPGSSLRAGQLKRRQVLSGTSPLTN
jgi:hypothetical protein